MADEKPIKHGPRFKDISGQKFGRLTVTSFAFIRKQGEQARTFWNCQCECGTAVVVPTGNIKSGHTRSCGCLDRDAVIKRNTKHGLWKIPEFHVWLGAKGRCFTPSDHAYRHYGGRGITMCHEWRDSFATFIADMGRRPSPRHTLDRIDVNGNYEPSNCRWTTYKQQMNNKRNNIRLTHDSKTMTLKEWSDELGIPYWTLLRRHTLGLDVFAPLRGGGWFR